MSGSQMVKRFSCLIACAALLGSVAGPASARSPVPLTDQQMDKVTAGSWSGYWVWNTTTRTWGWTWVWTPPTGAVYVVS